MSTITSDPIFQIVTTTLLTLLGTAGITYLFYKKQKKDLDDPEVTYIFDDTRVYIRTLYSKPIHNFTLTSIRQNGKPEYNAWKCTRKTMNFTDIFLKIPQPHFNMSSFKVKIQYQHKEHKYTDILTIYPQEKSFIKH